MAPGSASNLIKSVIRRSNALRGSNRVNVSTPTTSFSCKKCTAIRPFGTSTIDNTPQEPTKSDGNGPEPVEVDISLFSPLLDPHPSDTGPYHQIFFGTKPPFVPLPDEVVKQALGEKGNAVTIESLPPHSLDDRDIRKLMKFNLVAKRVVNQTGKGKIPSMYTLVVVGNGKGLVGYGEGKSERMGDAANLAMRRAIKNLAPVQLFEGRTIHSQLRAKFHATEIVMRPRPPGFGLRVSPYLHQVAKAAGISDLSAKVTRSNNPMNVIKMALMMLQTGSAPVGMGDGFGGKGRRLEKGIGMRTGEDLALMRGRRCQPYLVEEIP